MPGKSPSRRASDLLAMRPTKRRPPLEFYIQSPRLQTERSGRECQDDPPHLCCLSRRQVRVRSGDVARSPAIAGRSVLFESPPYSSLVHRLRCQCSFFRNCNPQKNTPSPANSIPSPPAVPQPSISSTVFPSFPRFSSPHQPIRFSPNTSRAPNPERLLPWTRFGLVTFAPESGPKPMSRLTVALARGSPQERIS